MRSKIIAGWICLVIIFGSIVIIDTSIDFILSVKGATLYVNETGSGGAFSSIQNAINAASDGDIVFVFNGTYKENVVVDKTITLVGEDAGNTTIDGWGNTIVVLITKDRTNVTGFSVINGNYGIYIGNADRCNVSRNNLSNNWNGIFLDQSLRSNITNNHASNNWGGIVLFHSRYNYIYDNNVSNNDNEGIIISNSHENNVTGNHLLYNDIGVFLKLSENNIILNNNITMNNYYGISIEESNETILSSNIMVKNGVFIRGNMLEHWNSHEIDILNTVNSKPLYYWKNQTAGTISPGAGQVILANCSNVNIVDQNLSSGSVGIIIGLSSNNNISGNNASFNVNYGIYLYYSPGNNIQKNTVSNCTRYGIYLYNSDGNNITENNASSNSDNGIYVDYSNGIVILNNTILNNDMNGVLIEFSQGNDVMDNYIALNDHGLVLRYSSKCNITNNNISKNEYGISLDSSLDNNISYNNVFKNWFGTRLDSSPNSFVSYNNFTNDGIYISGFFLEDYNTHNIPVNNLVNGKPIRFFKDSSGMIIDGDSISAGEIIMVNCSNMIVRDFNISNTDMAVEAVFINNSTIHKNNVSSNEITGVSLWYSSNVTITHNNASNIYNPGVSLMMIYNGITIVESSNINASDNIVKDNGGSGIIITTSSNNTISNNNLSNNTNFGMVFYEFSSDNIVSNNTVVNSWYGIILSWFCNNTLINKNNVSYNSNTGLAIISSCSNNTIIENNITNNDLGINIADSYDNRIYHNNFILNTNQSWDFTTYGNQWDNGYPSGGNFWSNYTGVDKFKGPNQDQVGSDAIGDTNYSIDSDSIDNYPLMFPYPFRPHLNLTILKQGWNLISVPLIQVDDSLTRVLENIEGCYDAVQRYNVTESGDPWKHTKVGKSFGNDLHRLNESMGFWIHIIKPGDTIFVYNGTQPTSNQSITLYPGWNMVGYPSNTSYNRTDGLNNIFFGSDVDAIWTYNATTQTWKEITASDNFEVGKGYWIHSKVTKTWIVPL